MQTTHCDSPRETDIASAQGFHTRGNSSEHKGAAGARRPLVLGRRASFWVAAAVVAHAMWTSAAPAMTYPLYAAEWGLTHTVTTAIFAIYPIVVVAVLIIFGDLSDYIGRRAAIQLGVASSLLGVLVFASATSVPWLFVGRALTGVGVGLSAGPSTAAIYEFASAGLAKRSSSVTAAAQSAGFASALLLGGALVEYAPFPTRLSFWVLAFLLALLLTACWFLPHCSKDLPPGHWHFRTPSVPADLRGPFSVSATAVTTAYTHGVLILSLGSQIAHDLVGSSNVFVNGAALSLFSIVTGLVGIAFRQLPYRTAVISGAILSGASMALLAWSVSQQSLVIFLTATATGGAAYALLFSGGLEVINAAAHADHRAGILSGVYLFAYLSLGSVALLLGVVATARGLPLAVDIGTGIIALLSGATITLGISWIARRSS
jgi:MFS family permease